MKRKPNRTTGIFKKRNERGEALKSNVNKSKAFKSEARSMIAEANKNTRRKQIYTRLSVISLIAAAMIITALFVFMMFRIGIITPPDYLKKISGVGFEDTNSAAQYDDERLNQPLPVTEYDEYFETQDFTEDEIYILLKENEPLDEYTLENVVTYYSPDGTRTTYTNKVWKRGGLYRVERYDSTGAKIRRVVSDGIRVNISEYSSEEVYSAYYNASADFSMEQQSGIMSVSDIRQSLFGANPDAAELITVKLVRNESMTLYRVEYSYPSLNITERVDISLDFGLIISAESRLSDSGELIYTLETASVVAGISGFDFNEVFNPDSAE